MVNNYYNNRTKKLKKEQPSLTIYPFSIDELKEPKLFPKAIDKNEKRTTEIGKNTQNENITQTQQETEQVVNQMYLVHYIFLSYL